MSQPLPTHHPTNDSQNALVQKEIECSNKHMDRTDNDRYCCSLRLLCPRHRLMLPMNHRVPDKSLVQEVHEMAHEKVLLKAVPKVTPMVVHWDFLKGLMLETKSI